MAEAEGGNPARGSLDRIGVWLRRRPFVAGGALAGLCGVIAALAVVFLVDGGEPANVPIDCTVYDSDESVRLTVQGTVTEKEAESGCNALAAQLSGSSSYWIVGRPAVPGSEPQLICALLGPADEGGRVIVEEDGEVLVSGATGICGRLAHEGWTQDETVGRGPWQREYDVEVLARELAEAEEQEQREAEIAAIEAEEEAIYACQERAEEAEEAELEAIERETEERMEAAPEAEEFDIEEEGWNEEEEAWDRGEVAIEACEARNET